MGDFSAAMTDYSKNGKVKSRKDGLGYEVEVV
jgi:hypothetical protein